MVKIKVLIEGAHKKINGKVKISSTSTLIQTNKNILVDTGSFLDREKLISELKNENLNPEDIDIVILTHLHLDHLVNVDLFKNSKIYCKFHEGQYPGQIHIPKEGCLQRIELREGTIIADDVSIILTPGHSNDMISVVVKTEKGNIVISGDAFSSESQLDLNKNPDPLFNDVERFNESRKKILEIADFIIPGHGKMFKVEK